MESRSFGQYLLEEGHVTRNALLEAMEHRHAFNRPLWAYALQKRYITPEQVEIIRLDLMKTSKTFTEVAVGKAFMTQDQGRELLDTQKEQKMDISVALVEKGAISQRTLDELLAAYRKEQGVRNEEQERVLTDVPHKELIDALMAATFKLFASMVGEIVTAVSVENNGNHSDDMNYTFIQKVRGTTNFYFGLSVPTELLLLISSRILHQEQTEVNELALDSACEFVNMAVGHGCVRLSLQDFVVEPDPPRTFQRGDPTPLGSESVCIRMKCKDHKFLIGFGFF